jgi:hypothetical protein
MTSLESYSSKMARLVLRPGKTRKAPVLPYTCMVHRVVLDYTFHYIDNLVSRFQWKSRYDVTNMRKKNACRRLINIG